MKKVNKYLYLVVLQGDYGYGWTDIASYDTAVPGWKKEMISDRRSYRENEPGTPFRTVRRRELNQEEENKQNK